jgi:hypothetical protein
MKRLSREHRRFLLLDQSVGPMVINFLLNGAIAWVVFRSAQSVPLWGQTSIAADTLATAFILPVMTSLIVSRLVRWQVRSGQLSPLPASQALSSMWGRRSSLHRGAVLGAVAVVLAAAPVVVLFAAIGPAELERWRFIWFKAGFAAALGALVTPLIAWWALAHASDEGP